MNKRTETALRKIAAGRIERGMESWRNTLAKIPGIGKLYQVGDLKVPNDGYPTFDERLDYATRRSLKLPVTDNSAFRQVYDNLYSSVAGREGAEVDARDKRSRNPKTLNDYVNSGVYRVFDAVDAYKNGGVLAGLLALKYPQADTKRLQLFDKLLDNRMRRNPKIDD